MDPDGGEVEEIFEELREGKLNAEYIKWEKKPIFHKIKTEKEKKGIKEGKQKRRGFLIMNLDFFSSRQTGWPYVTCLLNWLIH